MGINKLKVIIIILTILLIGSFGYIGVDKYRTAKIIEIQQVYQVGYNKGIEDAVTLLFQQTNNCQSTVISIGNVTRSVVDTSCLMTQ